MRVQFTLLSLLLIAACAPAATPGGPSPAAAPAQERPAEPARPLVILIRVEPVNVTTKPLRQAGTILQTTRRLFNGTFALLDDRGVPQPYLVEALPQLNSDSWRVFPDGRMETTYKLRPNATWHDGTPLTSDDFVFAWRVYSSPDLGVAGSVPQNLMEEVVGPARDTVVIRWRASYADAGVLTDGFAPLPRHLLADSFEAGPDWADAFVGHSFWTRDYVGLGPYRIVRWDPGTELGATAFPGHVLGKPKIERIILRWNSDPNTALAIMLAGEAHLSADTSLQFTHGSTLKREWAARNGGTILLKPDLWRAVSFQLRPDIVSPRATLDPRVRKAIAFAIDKPVLNEVQFEGDGFMSDTIIPPTVEFFPAIDRAIAKYPLDLRRSEQLMNEAGFAKASDGMYASPAEGRLSLEIKTNGGAFFESEMSIIASSWRQAGFDFREAVNPAALAQDNQVRATYPSLFVFSSGLGEPVLVQYTTAGIPRAENRWAGQNRGGWSNPEFDALTERFTTTLDRQQRSQLIADMTRVFNDDLPAITLYFQPSVFAHAVGLRGPRVVAPDSAITWNIQEWELN